MKSCKTTLQNSRPSACFHLLTNTLKVEFHMPPPRAAVASPSGKHPIYKGIRTRSGKWVSEIREPRKTTRIWLGTYPTPEMAAAAYDAASLVLKGPDTALNFPNHMYTNLLLLPREPRTAAWIRVAAANAAASWAVASPRQLAQDIDVNNFSSDTYFLGAEEEYVDEEELFNMPDLLMHMAEGMLVHPPSRISISPPISDNSEEESLWS